MHVLGARERLALLPEGDLPPRAGAGAAVGARYRRLSRRYWKPRTTPHPSGGPGYPPRLPRPQSFSLAICQLSSPVPRSPSTVTTPRCAHDPETAAEAVVMLAPFTLDARHRAATARCPSGSPARDDSSDPSRPSHVTRYFADDNAGKRFRPALGHSSAPMRRGERHSMTRSSRRKLRVALGHDTSGEVANENSGIRRSHSSRTMCNSSSARCEPRHR